MPGLRRENPRRPSLLPVGPSYFPRLMHLYVHVPFCARRCSYCDFAIAVRREVPSRDFADAIRMEWTRCLDDPLWDSGSGPEPITTIYFGGGTPSRLDPVSVEAMLAQFARDRHIAPGAEITLEANPEDVTRDRVALWRSSGINRVSLGVQSFHPGVLSWMHRTHDAAQARDAVELLRSRGIENLSLDLIFGVPREVPRSWEADLDQALALSPDHLSFYGLTVESATALGKWVERGEIPPADESLAAEEYLHAHATVVAQGWNHYEVSNAASPGRESRHNAGYWAREPFLGLGPSAHSGAGTRRRWNVRHWAAWQHDLLAGLTVTAGEEQLTPEQITLEDRYLGLRTSRGLPEADIPSELRASWIREGWARAVGGRVVLTIQGWLRLDALLTAPGWDGR